MANGPQLDDGGGGSRDAAAAEEEEAETERTTQQEDEPRRRSPDGPELTSGSQTGSAGPSGGGGTSEDPRTRTDSGGTSSEPSGDGDRTGPSTNGDGPTVTTGTPSGRDGDARTGEEVPPWRRDMGGEADGQEPVTESEARRTVRDRVRDFAERSDFYSVRDFEIVRVGNRVVARLTEAARRRRRDLEGPSAGDSRVGTGAGEPAITSGPLEVGTDFLADLDFGFGEEPGGRGQRVDVEQVEREADRAETEARQDIVSQLEEQYGVDLGQGDVAFEREGRQIRGRLSEQGQRRVEVETSLVVETFAGTPLADEARAVAGGAADFRAFGRQQREGTVQPALDQLRETSGLSEEIEGFDAFSQRQQERVDAGVAEARRLLDIDAQEVGTGLVAAGAAGIVAPEPVTSVAGGGAVIVGGSILAAGAAGAALDEATQPRADVSRTATAQVPGMFPPEQRTPDRPAGNMFVAEQEVEPSSLELPELQAPTERPAAEGGRTAARPEIAVPMEPAGATRPELGTPTEPASSTQPELEVPMLEAQQAIQRGRQTARENARRQRRRGGRVEVPGEFIPEGTVTIGGEVGRGESATGGATGITVLPNPRSTELRRIETPEGGFRVGAELSRFLAAQERNVQVAQPEVETGVETGEGAPGRTVPGLFGLGVAASDGARRRRDVAEAPFTERRNALVALISGGAREDVRADQALAQRQQQRLSLLTGQAEAQTTRSAADAATRLLAGQTAAQVQRPAQTQAQAQEQRTGQRTTTANVNALLNPTTPATATPTAFVNQNVPENVFETPPTEAPPRRSVPRFPILGIESDDQPPSRNPFAFATRARHFEFQNPLAPVGGGQSRRKRDDDGSAALAALLGGGGGGPSGGIPGFTDGADSDGRSEGGIDKLLGGFF